MEHKKISEMSTKQIDYQSQIQALFQIAEINLKVCKQIENFLDELDRKKSLQHNPKRDFLLSTSYNAFAEAVSILYSLLGKKRDKREIDLGVYRDKYASDVQKQGAINMIISLYERAGIDEIRHNIIDHKNSELVKRPEDYMWNRLNPPLLQDVEEIIDCLGEGLHLWFSTPTPWERKNPNSYAKVGLCDILSEFAHDVEAFDLGKKYSGLSKSTAKAISGMRIKNL